MKSSYHSFQGNWKEYIKEENVVYCITNLINNTIYIGIAKKLQKRLRDYGAAFKSNKKYSDFIVINKALKKYGISNFSFDVIEICKNYNLCGFQEKYWIKYIREMGIKNYNISDGGQHLTINNKKGTEIYNAVLNKEMIHQIFELYHIDKLSSKKICKIMGIHNDSTILNILNGKTYTDITSNLIKQYPTVRKYSYYKGENNSNSGINSYKALFTEIDIIKIFKMYHVDMISSRSIGKVLNINFSAIASLLNGRTYPKITNKLILQYGKPRTSTFHLHRK